MSIVSTDEYLRKGHQMDLDYLNLDSLITGLNQENVVPVGDLSTWYALKSEWDTFYQHNIQDVPITPWQSTGDFDTWLDRWNLWKGKANGWAAESASNRAKAIARALPESPAVIMHREEQLAAQKPVNIPVWGWLAFGVLGTAALGYALSSAARLGGR